MKQKATALASTVFPMSCSNNAKETISPFTWCHWPAAPMLLILVW